MGDIGYLVLRETPLGWMVIGPKGWNPSTRLTTLAWFQCGKIYKKRDSALRFARENNDVSSLWVWEVNLDDRSSGPFVQLNQPLSYYGRRARIRSGDPQMEREKAIQMADEFWKELLKFCGEYELSQVVSFFETQYVKYKMGH